MKKAIVSFVLAIALALSLTACSVSSNGSGGLVIRPSFEIGNSNYNKNEYTMTLGDEFTTIGVGRGSTIKVKLDGYGARVSFDIRVDLSKVTKDKVVEELTDFMQSMLGATGGTVSSVQSVSNNTRLKFEVYFKF